MRLKLLILLSSLLTLLAIVGGFSLLSVNYFVRGMDSVVGGQMEQAARRYLATVPEAQRGRLNTVDGYYFASDWNLMPATIKDAFGAPPAPREGLQKIDDSGWFEHPHTLHFLLRLPIDDVDYFIARTMTHKDKSREVGRSARRSLQLLVVVSVSTLLALGLLLWLLSRRISQPVSALVNWTCHLDTDTLRQPPPAFGFPELDEIARLIRTSLSSVQDSLEREHQFQRHVSHELRTPISVVRNNVNLLRKLEQQQTQIAASQLGPIVDRIDRASMTMKNLTHTLLWLSRGDPREMLPATQVALDELVQEVTRECRYLLKDKSVTVHLETSTCTLLIPAEPARIVLANIIQNAFQHTWEGDVKIHQQGNCVEVINRNHHSNGQTDDLGFGLGLRLIDELAQRLQWQYQNIPQTSGHQVTVTFSQTAPMTPNPTDIISP